MPENNITNYTAKTNDEVYEYFNKFIFSDDIKVIGKLLFKYHFFEKTKHLAGDIVEVGVFRGSGMVVWLKILKIFCGQTNKKVIGFDFFSSEEAIQYTKDRQSGSSLKDIVERVGSDELELGKIVDNIRAAGIDDTKYILVKGDIAKTTKEFALRNPGFRISILYLDADLEEPTYASLLYLWDRIVPGGYIVFDEYDFHTFNESTGVEKFLREKKLEYSIETTNFINPSAFMIKKCLS